MERFKNQKLIHKRYVARLLLSCEKYFETHPSLTEIVIPEDAPDNDPSAPPRVTVCGDTHGQFYDVLNIFEMNGYPSHSNPYLFNGDFVDRGSFSVEVILTYLMWKISDPTCIYLTRGNHETKNMNKIYGFEGEVKAKYDEKIFELFLELFCHLPLAAVIENKVFVTHGGLPTDEGVTLEDVRKIKRGMEPPESGLMSDLLWSDPQPFPGKSPSKRGVGFSFGPDITARFLEHNNLSLLVRSHEGKKYGAKLVLSPLASSHITSPIFSTKKSRKRDISWNMAGRQSRYSQRPTIVTPWATRELLFILTRHWNPNLRNSLQSLTPTLSPWPTLLGWVVSLDFKRKNFWSNCTHCILGKVSTISLFK